MKDVVRSPAKSEKPVDDVWLAGMSFINKIGLNVWFWTWSELILLTLTSKDLPVR